VPRFVLLKHTLPDESPRPTHWDFMLEQEGILRTWALAAEPQDGLPIPATALDDHRLAYLDYEGEISGGRGSVARCDRGDYQTIRNTADRLEVTIAGEQWKGRVTLTKEEDQRWRFVFAADAALVGSSSS
jgi:hypothetical protein